jgi:hypothetical protein
MAFFTKGRIFQPYDYSAAGRKQEFGTYMKTIAWDIDDVSE